MTLYRLIPVVTLFAGVLLVACTEPTPPAAVADTAPAPAESPTETSVPIAAFDVRAFAGSFSGVLPCAPCVGGLDTRINLKTDGSFLLVETENGLTDANPREINGTWTTEGSNSQLLLDPDSKAEPDRRYDITSNNELRLHDLDNVPAGTSISLFRSTAP